VEAVRYVMACQATAFATVMMKNAVFWDLTLCDSCKNRRFGGTYRLHHPSDKNRRARNVSSLILVRPYIPPKRWFLQEPHGVTSHKMALHSHRRETLKSYIALTDWAL
jgi:hypothetical protein